MMWVQSPTHVRKSLDPPLDPGITVLLNVSVWRSEMQCSVISEIKFRGFVDQAAEKKALYVGDAGSIARYPTLAREKLTPSCPML